MPIAIAGTKSSAFVYLETDVRHSISQNFSPAGVTSPLCGAGNTNGPRFRRVGKWAVAEAFASHAHLKTVVNSAIPPDSTSMISELALSHSTATRAARLFG